MTIDKYIRNLIMQLRNPTETTNINKIRAMLTYARAYKQGEEGLKRYRHKAIAAEISRKHDMDAQIAIGFNKDICPEEYAAYQAFRAECKVKVDANMTKLEKEITNILLQ